MYISDKDADKAVDSTNNFYIMVGAGCGVIALIAIIVAIVYLRGPKPIRNNERLRYVDTKKERKGLGRLKCHRIQYILMDKLYILPGFRSKLPV